MDILTNLFYLIALIFIGMGCNKLSKQLKLPNSLLLICAGLLLQYFWVLMNFWFSSIKVYIPDSQPLLSFPGQFTAFFALFVLIFAVFESASKVRLREFDDLSKSALRLAFVLLLVSSIALSFMADFVLGLQSFTAAMIFSVLMIGTHAEFFAYKSGEIFQFLQHESLINMPLALIIPFVLSEFPATIGGVGLFVQQLLIGLGIGVVIALLMLKFVHKNFRKTFSQPVLLALALIVYALAEHLQSNGIVAVGAFGFMLSNFASRLRNLQEIYFTHSVLLEMIVFILLGLLIELRVDLILLSLALFALFFLVRLVAIEFVLISEYDFKEKLFMALAMPKGVATAVAMIALFSKPVYNLGAVLSVALLFVLYSNILAAIVSHYSGHFLGRE